MGVDKVSYDYCGVCGSEIEVRHGITKREYFAAMAMQALVAKCYDDFSVREIVKDSFIFADAMLAESEKSGSNK